MAILLGPESPSPRARTADLLARKYQLEVQMARLERSQRRVGVVGEPATPEDLRVREALQRLRSQLADIDGALLRQA